MEDIQPLTIAVLASLVQLVVVAAGAIWVVASIKAKTETLSTSIHYLAQTISRLDSAVEKLDQSVRELDRRVTRLESIAPITNHNPNNQSGEHPR